jgi:hypothetical protein
MAARVLSFEHFATVPFRDEVEPAIKRCLQPLVDSGDLQIDLTGRQADSALYVLTFEKDYAWTDLDRLGCLHKPLYYGTTGVVNLEAIRRKNMCRDVTRCDTCERLFHRSPDEYGRMITSTALHEIGHLFGLNDGAAFTGSDGSGHSGDPANMMFAITNHKDYKPPEEDSARTVKYTIAKDDTFSEIARRIGFWPPTTIGVKKLSELKGKDGKRNLDLLKSKDAAKITAGEQIWIPDIPARIRFTREMELKVKTYTKEQYDTMRAFIKAGKTID